MPPLAHDRTDDDARRFAPEVLPTLRWAVNDLSWLASRGYAADASLALVGNRYQLHARQRVAVRRSACSDAALADRRRRQRPLEGCREVAIDGFNLLVTLEVAQRGGVLLAGRDGCLRDLAAARGRLDEAVTGTSIRLVTEHLVAAGVEGVRWLLDRPVPYSGRLRAQLERDGAHDGLACAAEVVDDPDAILADRTGPVVSSDARVLDGRAPWVDLASAVVDQALPHAWRVDLGGGGP